MLVKGHGQGHTVKSFGMNGNASSSGIIHVKYESPTSNGLKYIGIVKVFIYVGQRSQSRLQCQNFFYELRGVITRNVYVKYESPTFNGSQVMANIVVFKDLSMNGKVSSLGMYM